MLLYLLLFVTSVLAEFPGPIKLDIDSDKNGMPDKLRYADNLPIYPGSRCGENFYIKPPKSTNGRNTDAMLCVGRPKDDAKEQDGDSGGPVFTNIDGVRVQVGVNTGSYPADYFRDGTPADSHIGYYTRVDWPTIKPWLKKILSGDLVGAKAMTCEELGGKTSPDPSPHSRQRHRNLLNYMNKNNDQGNKDKIQEHQRRLISGSTKEASATDFPSLISTGNYYDRDVLKVWEPGCDGTLIGNKPFGIMLAAAHCFSNTELKASSDQMRMWPGAWDLLEPEKNASKFRFASEIIRHPCYTLTNYPLCLEAYPDNCRDKTKPMEDIAVAIMNDPASSGVVTPLLGQDKFESDSLTFPVMGTIAGWGRYCDPKADNDPTKCTMNDYDVPNNTNFGENDTTNNNDNNNDTTNNNDTNNNTNDNTNNNNTNNDTNNNNTNNGCTTGYSKIGNDCVHNSIEFDNDKHDICHAQKCHNEGYAVKSTIGTVSDNTCFCLCLPGYFGNTCQTKISGTETRSVNSLFVILVVLVSLCISI